MTESMSFALPMTALAGSQATLVLAGKAAAGLSAGALLAAGAALFLRGRRR